jgi:Cu+-exporting ATPase
MLTGDNEITADIIAKSIGIKEVIANVSPKDKSNKIKELKNKGFKVMMVGDGINDAPSLSLADIGVSLNSAIDIAVDSADVILMRNDLNSIYNLFDIGKKTLGNIKENLFWAFFYNACMIPISCGLFKFINITMNPMIAGLAMTLSSFTVIINALRLKRWKER